jgi:hypothetical protein
VPAVDEVVCNSSGDAAVVAEGTMTCDRRPMNTPISAARRNLDELFARYNAGERAALYPMLLRVASDVGEMNTRPAEEPRVIYLHERCAKLLQLLLGGDAISS